MKYPHGYSRAMCTPKAIAQQTIAAAAITDLSPQIQPGRGGLGQLAGIGWVPLQLSLPFVASASQFRPSDHLRQFAFTPP